MPLILPQLLPASQQLQKEGFDILPQNHPADIHIAMINLMPIMAETEYDFLQLLAPLDKKIRVSLCNMQTHTSRHTPKQHTDDFYVDFKRIASSVEKVIITGAPLENVAFENVDYWKEITEIFDFLYINNIPTLNICWAAFASIYHRYGIGWKILDEKISGLYPHTIYRPDPILKVIADGFSIPHSRYATWDIPQLKSCDDISIISGGDDQGPFLIADKHAPHYYMVGHGEYHHYTLHNEYYRDLGKGMNPIIPRYYFPNNDPTKVPFYTWHETALQIYKNWINL